MNIRRICSLPLPTFLAAHTTVTANNFLILSLINMQKSKMSFVYCGNEFFAKQQFKIF